MDVQNFLFLKKKYTSILRYLNEIMNEYDNLQSCINENHLIDKCNKYKNEINELKYLINNINYQLGQLCEHEYEEDEIDVSPDKSIKIEYCKICEYSKEFGFS